MATTTANNNGKAGQPGSEFEIRLSRGRTTLVKGDTQFEVVPGNGAGNIIVNNTGRGVQVKAAGTPVPEQDADQKPVPAIEPSDDLQTVTTYGATLTAPHNNPAAVTTNGTVTLVSQGAETETAAEAEAQTGIHVSFGEHEAAVSLKGTEAAISYYDRNDIAVYARLIQIKPATVAAEASVDSGTEAPAENGDVKISLSTTFNSAFLEGLNAKVKIALDQKGRAVIGTEGFVESMVAEEVAADPALDIDGDVVRLTLAGGKAFDINTTNGDVIAYVSSRRERYGIQEIEEDDDAAKKFEVVIGGNGNRLVLNNTTLEKTPDNAVTVTTDGVSRIRSVDETPSAVAREDSKAGLPARESWKYLVTLDSGRIQLVADEDPGAMDGKRAQKLIEKIRRDNPAVSLPDDNALLLAFQHAARMADSRQPATLPTGCQPSRRRQRFWRQPPI